MIRLFKGGKQKARKANDDTDPSIPVIEKFAPREYRKQRELFFYNYRMLSLYRKPLTALLETLCQIKRLDTDPVGFRREIFLRLKAFYDPRDRLSLEEAKRDAGLKRKLKDIFLFFYGKRAVSSGEIDEWIEELQP